MPAPACHAFFWYNNGTIASGGYVLGTLMHRGEELENVLEAYSAFHSTGGVVIIAA
jgi:hypothetical protein